MKWTLGRVLIYSCLCVLLIVPAMLIWSWGGFPVIATPLAVATIILFSYWIKVDKEARDDLAVDELDSVDGSRSFWLRRALCCSNSSPKQMGAITDAIAVGGGERHR